MIMYLPAQTPSWHRAWLNVPDTWQGGKRKVTIRVDYTQSRVLDGVTHYWVEVTAQTDPHLMYRSTTFMPEHLITERKRS